MNGHWIDKAWAAREAVRQGLLTIVELLVVLALFAWTVAGLLAYGVETGWGMRGLLTLVDERLRGALILGFVLFYGFIRRALGKLVHLKVGDAEAKFLQQGPPVAPTSAPETIL